MTSRRQQRVDELLLEEISLIVQELNDPRLSYVSVTDVEVSPDLRYARVFISHMGEAEETPLVLKALGHAASYIRHELAQRAILRYVPEMSFHLDNSLERGERIERLLQQVGLG